MEVEKAFLEIEFALIFSPLPPSLLLLFSSPLALSNYSRSPSFYTAHFLSSTVRRGPPQLVRRTDPAGAKIMPLKNKK